MQCYPLISTIGCTGECGMTYHVKRVVAFAQHFILSAATRYSIQNIVDVRKGHSSPGNLHFEQVLS